MSLELSTSELVECFAGNWNSYRQLRMQHSESLELLFQGIFPADDPSDVRMLEQAISELSARFETIFDLGGELLRRLPSGETRKVLHKFLECLQPGQPAQDIGRAAKLWPSLAGLLDSFAVPPASNSAAGDTIDLNGTDQVVFDALTTEYQKVSVIAAATRMDEGRIRRSLADLKRRGLIEHKRGIGYRRR